MSYEDLDATTARLYRGLAEHPGVEFTAGPVAAGLDVLISAVDRGLGRLVEANLVTETGDERYRLHDVLREHVQALADQGDQGERLTVRRRVIEWYLWRAAAADEVINLPPPVQLRLRRPRHGCVRRREGRLGLGRHRAGQPSRRAAGRRRPGLDGAGVPVRRDPVEPAAPQLHRR
ncbi:transcriptional regulator, SARP family [Alloactinosynnema sp. L-07]|nr:transcriptional regulator, SARP family [Alloactinosynnema sp. L-07]